MLSTLTLFTDFTIRKDEDITMDNNIIKKASESRVEQVYQIRPEHLNGNPTKVPGLLIESIGQQAEWEAGQKRKQLRIQRKTEGF